MLMLRAALAAVTLAASAALASPYTLTYCPTPGQDGRTNYTFTLTLDNHDGSWQQGQGIGWVIFGDNSSSSPLINWQTDPSSFPIGPWTSIQGSGGGHNGPTLSPVVVQAPPYDLIYWVPGRIGDFLTWRGSAAANVPESAMQWSALFGLGSPGVNFEQGRISCASACGTADFDGDGDVGTDRDIESFFRCLAGSCCATCFNLGADFDADGDVGTDRDIEAFFRVLAGNPC